MLLYIRAAVAGGWEKFVTRVKTAGVLQPLTLPLLVSSSKLGFWMREAGNEAAATVSAASAWARARMMAKRPKICCCLLLLGRYVRTFASPAAEGDYRAPPLLTHAGQNV